MRQIIPCPGKPLLLGRLGENEATAVRFDITGILEEYGDAEFTLVYEQPSQDEGYPVTGAYPNYEEGYLEWIVTDTDLSAEGRGRAQLIAESGGTIVKTEIYMTMVLPALDGAGDPPSPWDSWQEAFGTMASETQNAARRAAEQAQIAWEDAQIATEAKEDALAAQQAAETAASEADTSAAAAAASAAAAEAAAATCEASPVVSGTGVGSAKTKNFSSSGTDYSNVASGTGAFAEGMGTSASGQASHAEGFMSTASGPFSHAEGNNTKATGNRSHAEGDSTVASGFWAHAEGYGTEASGQMTHAEGNRSSAAGYGSHAEGNQTIAAGANEHAEGAYNKTSPLYPAWAASTSYAVGDRVIRNNATYECQVANSDATFVYRNWRYVSPGTGPRAFVVGNGTGPSESMRSNAAAIDWDGTAHFAGDVYVSANADSSGGEKLVKTSELVTLKSAIDDKLDKPSTAGTSGQVLGLNSGLEPVWIDQSGSGGGGLSAAAAELLYNILMAGVYTSNQVANLSALAALLHVVIVTKSGSTLTLANVENITSIAQNGQTLVCA